MEVIQEKYQSLSAILDERARRLWAATEARALGRGAVTIVASATGLARNTIYAGLSELSKPASRSKSTESLASRTRRPGGGRKAMNTTGWQRPGGRGRGPCCPGRAKSEVTRDAVHASNGHTGHSGASRARGSLGKGRGTYRTIGTIRAVNSSDCSLRPRNSEDSAEVRPWAQAVAARLNGYGVG